ncbi:MAG TPA: PilZ domain-containing protein [Acidimicrobiales bacterium]
MEPVRTVASAEVKYFVLADRVGPYLLARVRWPDVAQAVTAGCRDWRDDPGLFDLPYDPGSAVVTPVEAAAIAAGWGVRLPTEATFSSSLPPVIRRMPANWSNLAPAEKRAWSLDYVLTRRRANASRHTSALSTGRGLWGSRLRRRSAVVERRHDVRVHVGGRAEIHQRNKTVSTDLVDISPGGMHCVALDAKVFAAAGARLDAPLVLTAFDRKIRLDVGGTVTWHSETGRGTHFGIAFDQLDDAQIENIQHLLVTSGAPRELLRP